MIEFLICFLLLLTMVVAVADDEDEGWLFPVNRSYQPYLAAFFIWFHGVAYDQYHQFSKADLLELTPRVVYG